jgi:hypothetical protein
MFVGWLLKPQFGFPALWMLGVGLAQIRLFSFQHSAWSLRAWAVALLVPGAFGCGALLGQSAADRVQKLVRRTPEPSPSAWRRASVFLLAIGTLESIHQFVVAGGVPLLQHDIDKSRFALPGGPAVVLMNCAPLAAVVALAGPRRFDPRRYRAETAVVIAGLLVTTLAGGRGLVILGLGVAVLVRALRFGAPSVRFVGATVLVLVLFVSAIFFVRTRQNVGQPFESELYGSVLPGIPAPLRVLVPVHLAIASNFEALARVVDFIPTQMPFGHGAYDAVGFDLVIPGSKKVTDVSAQLTGPFVTTTVAGPLWADGGFGWVAAGMATIGALATGAHQLAARTGTLRFTLPAAYLTYLCFFGIYTSLFTQHPDWVVITPLLFLIGAWLDGVTPGDSLRRRSPYRVVHAIHGRIKVKAASFTRRRTLLAAFAALLAILIAAAVIGATLGTDPGVRDVPSASALLVGSVPGPPSDVLSNGDAALDNEPLWTVRRTPAKAVLTGYRLLNKRWSKVDATSVPVKGPRKGSRYDVGGWAGEAQALFVIRPTSKSVSVAVWGTDAQKELSLGVADEPSLFQHGVRDVAIATYSGQLPDLFILDRGVPDERARLAVFSGESGFREQILKVRLPVVGLTPTKWSVDVGRVDGARPDVILLTPRGSSGLPEVHLVSGTTGYTSFRLQAPVRRLTLGPALEDAVRIVTVGGAPTAAAIDGTKGARAQVSFVRLAPPTKG